MSANGKWGLVAVGMLVMAAAVPATESGVPQALPDGVTAEMVEEGRTLLCERRAVLHLPRDRGGSPEPGTQPDRRHLAQHRGPHIL